jgi:hypothetical protein
VEEGRSKHSGANSWPQPNGVLEWVEGLSWVPTKRITGVKYQRMAALSELKGRVKGVDEVLLSIRDFHIHAKNQVVCFCSAICDRLLKRCYESNAYMGIPPKLLAIIKI